AAKPVIGTYIGRAWVWIIRGSPVVRFRYPLLVLAGAAYRSGIYPSTVSKARKAVRQYCLHLAWCGLCGIAFYCFFLIGFCYRCLRLPLAARLYADPLGQRYRRVLDGQVFWQEPLIRAHIA